ncbi:MAG TPA: hypothetical protein VK308_12735, partial [Pyrinomonadaceae bacterium]|nr:hypothetical protein [Pyrinomonadaceae bacterium]
MNKRLSIVAFSLIAFVFFAVLIGFNNPSLAQNQNEILSEEDNLSELTVKIASLTTKFRNKKFYENNQLEDSITELAERRYSKLTELIENDTMEVLRVALPEDVLSKIPFELQNYFEKREETEGELEVVSECEDNDERILYYLKNGKERLSLRFAKQPDEELRTGERVSIKGVRIGETIAVDESSLPKNSDSFQASAMTLPNTFGEQKVLVLLVNFQNDQRQPFTIDQARNLVFGTVNNFYREASYQQTWLTGDAYGYFTLPINSGDCGGSQTATYARQAAINAGINVSAYNKFMYVYPQMSGCNYSGRGTIGGNEVWLNGSLSQWTVAHELGHNYGLYHARALECGSAVLGNNCSTIEYGNTVDTMGTENAHFHSYQKERLGWLNFNVSPPITTVQTGGNYFIAPYSAQDGKTKALKILKSVDSSGNKTWYHLEVRRPIGFDRFVLSNSNFMNGVIITMNKETNGQENYLL